MGMNWNQRLGMASLLVIPIFAYWAYNIIINRKKSPDHTGQQSLSGDDIANDTSGVDCKDSAEHQKPNVEPHSADDYRITFTRIQQGLEITANDCAVLTSLLQSPNSDKLTDGLQLTATLSITSASNKNTLLEHGIARELKRITRCWRNVPKSVAQLSINVVNNLSLSDQGQLLFTDLVAELIDIGVNEDDSLAIISLQCLTNLSVTSNSHDNFTKVIHTLYNALDLYPHRRIHICKVLVNLSANDTLAPHLLAAKRAECSCALLLTDMDIVRRWLRFLVNVTQSVLSNEVTENCLPTMYKAASPETLYSFLYGSADEGKLTQALLGGHQGGDEELHRLANQLFQNIKLKRMVTANTS